MASYSSFRTLNVDLGAEILECKANYTIADDLATIRIYVHITTNAFKGSHQQELTVYNRSWEVHTEKSQRTLLQNRLAPSKRASRSFSKNGSAL